MPFPDPIPVNSTRAKMLWLHWLLLIARFTGTALRLAGLPTLPWSLNDRHDLVRPPAWPSGKRSFLGVSAEAILASSLASGMAATPIVRRASTPVGQGRCSVPRISRIGLRRVRER